VTHCFPALRRVFTSSQLSTISAVGFHNILFQLKKVPSISSSWGLFSNISWLGVELYLKIYLLRWSYGFSPLLCEYSILHWLTF
jgi:hypothetical protein